MTPRPKIVAVDREATLDDLLRVLADKNFSRVPVYEGSLDNIIGVVSTRDLIQMTDQELKQTRAWERVREVPMVPETKPVPDLMRELQKSNQRMAIVVDEYGGVSGLATMEDLVEEIVGEIGEEGEKPEAAAQPDGSWIISGQAALDVLEREFGWTLPEGSDSTTVAGLVNTLAGHVPRPGEMVASDGLRFEVLAATDTLVSRLRVTRQPKTPAIAH
jgi:CBS domain containing-hemolysin-like protein